MNAKEQRRQDWHTRIEAYRASGLTMKAWCSANHCSVEQLKYWLYKIKRRIILSFSPRSKELPRPPWVNIANSTGLSDRYAFLQPK